MILNNERISKMKNVLFCLTLVALSVNIFAQDKVYVSEKYGNALKLIIKEDKTYQLIYNEGVYEQKLDSLYLSSNKKSTDNSASFFMFPV